MTSLAKIMVHENAPNGNAGDFYKDLMRALASEVTNVRTRT